MLNLDNCNNLPGVPFTLSGQKLLVPSLTLRQFRDNYQALTQSVEGESVVDQIDRALPVITVAVQRNYPDVTEDDLRDNVDLGSFRELLLAVQGASGLKSVAPGE